MTFSKEMQKALEADGEKLRQLTGEDHGPEFWNTCVAKSPGAPQQLVARIKRSSKYAYQAPRGGWFDVRVVPDMGYGLRGNNNNYRFADVVFGVRLDDGTIVELKVSAMR